MNPRRTPQEVQPKMRSEPLPVEDQTEAPSTLFLGCSDSVARPRLTSPKVTNC